MSLMSSFDFQPSTCTLAWMHPQRLPHLPPDTPSPFRPKLVQGCLMLVRSAEKAHRTVGPGVLPLPPGAKLAGEPLNCMHMDSQAVTFSAVSVAAHTAVASPPRRGTTLYLHCLPLASSKACAFAASVLACCRPFLLMIPAVNTGP